MPNPYFKFKQFTIYQDRCAMKVCTDACLFGAWVAKYFKEDQPEKILDIGTGTGLLSLMLAQQSAGLIDTIEIDESAYLQAIDNVGNSKWKDRVSIFNADVTGYDFQYKYDLVISNPPFYENSLRSPDVASNMARHEETLTLEALLAVADTQLASDGSLAILIPFHRTTYLLHTAARFNFFPACVVNVRQSDHHDFFRAMMILRKHPWLGVTKKELSIMNEKNYSPEFIELLKDYYLYL